MFTDRSASDSYCSIVTDVCSNKIIETNLRFKKNDDEVIIKYDSAWLESKTQNLPQDSNKAFLFDGDSWLINVLLQLKRTRLPNIRILEETSLSDFFKSPLNKLDKKYYFIGKNLFIRSEYNLTTNINLNTDDSKSIIYYDKDHAIESVRQHCIRGQKIIGSNLTKVFYPIFEIVNNKKTKIILPENLNHPVTETSKFIEHDYDAIEKYGLYKSKYVNTAFNFWNNYRLNEFQKDLIITATATAAAATIYKLIN